MPRSVYFVHKALQGTIFVNVPIKQYTSSLGKSQHLPPARSLKLPIPKNVHANHGIIFGVKSLYSKVWMYQTLSKDYESIQATM
ncbi:hypothetical protein PT974_01223 [Cladobotryum mycophilum]|uniref:Uncharacterized protein n=1 Tax=Cladobotryum mycophilum TaxID=491253 RepID=A0ABR0T3N5_9HYPO